MAYDGIFLYSVVMELNKKILGLKIDKVNQPEKDEIILTFRGNKKLVLSASANYPRAHLTTISKSNPQQPPNFCMLLRKYLIGAKLLKIQQISIDRILIFDFESTDDLGFNSVYSLICEIMGRHSNITLVRKRDNKIMDSIKHITPDINSYRVLLPGLEYVYPPSSLKLDPSNFSESHLKELLSQNDFDENFCSNSFTGISKPTSKSIYIKLKESKNLSEDLVMFLNDIFLGEKFNFVLYKASSLLKDFYCFPLEAFANMEAFTFSSSSELLDEYYSKKDKQDRINNRTFDLQKLVHTHLDRTSKKIIILTNTLSQCEEKDNFRIMGELITANIYLLKPGMKTIDLENYYSENQEVISIPLDENKTPSENIQLYFSKYNKLKKTEVAAKEQLRNAKEELDYLNSVLNSINTLEHYSEIEDIRRELMESGYIANKKTSKIKPKPSKPMHFLSSNGIDIYVGKNNLQNDYLTLKFADRTDIWLHAKDLPGSHVIIKNKYPDENTLLEAATLAAYYSKAHNSSKVPIDYTEVRNVKKPSHSKPGMVIYYTNKTIYVDSSELSIKRIE